MTNRVFLPRSIRRRLKLSRQLGCMLAAVALSVTLSAAAAADDDEAHSSRYPKITVSAEASVTAAPDTAKFTLGVTATHTEPDIAMRQNADRMKKVLRRLRAGLPPEQLRTLQVDLQKVQVWNSEKRIHIFQHYEARNQISVTVHNRLDSVPGLIGDAIAAGANLAGGLTFTLKDSEPQETAALQAATKKLFRKARAIARAGGYRLGAVLRLSELKQPQLEAAYLRLAGAATAGAASAAPPVEAGQLTITASLQADFMLCPQRESPRHPETSRHPERPYSPCRQK